YRKIGRFGALENSVDKIRFAISLVEDARTIRNETAALGEFRMFLNKRKLKFESLTGDLLLICKQGGRHVVNHGFDAFPLEIGNCRFNLRCYMYRNGLQIYAELRCNLIDLGRLSAIEF